MVPAPALPEMALPEMALPEMALPEMALPEMAVAPLVLSVAVGSGLAKTPACPRLCWLPSSLCPSLVGEGQREAQGEVPPPGHRQAPPAQSRVVVSGWLKLFAAPEPAAPGQWHVLPAGLEQTLEVVRSVGPPEGPWMPGEPKTQEAPLVDWAWRGASEAPEPVAARRPLPSDRTPRFAPAPPRAAPASRLIAPASRPPPAGAAPTVRCAPRPLPAGSPVASAAVPALSLSPPAGSPALEAPLLPAGAAAAGAQPPLVWPASHCAAFRQCRASRRE